MIELWREVDLSLNQSVRRRSNGICRRKSIQKNIFFIVKKNPDGTTTPVNYGVLGIEEFREGKIPSRVTNFLSSINFMDATVFEIGFGRGEALKYAREKGAKRCFGVDFSANAVKIAKEFLSPIIQIVL